jgi:hypothetical protein
LRVRLGEFSFVCTDNEREATLDAIGSVPQCTEALVSVLMRFTPDALTAEQYDAVVQRLTEEGIQPADGLDYEVCFGSGDKMKVSLVWDTPEQMEAFGALLMPILAEFGIDPGEPEVLPVHNIIKR